MKKYLFIPIFFICCTLSTYSQVGGISASKLSTLCTDPVDKHQIEFEPSFAISKQNKYWDTDKNLQNTYQSTDSSSIQSELMFRFSYGAAENLEIGATVDAGINGVSIGAKYQIPVNENLAFAPFVGSNFIAGNRINDKTVNSSENTPNYVAGLISTCNFSDKFSLDCDVQFQKFYSKVIQHNKFDYFLNADIGYYIVEKLQLCSGLNYGSNVYTNSVNNSNLLILNLGATVEPGDNYLFVINTPIAISGDNAEKSIGIGFALTITFE